MSFATILGWALAPIGLYGMLKAGKKSRWGWAFSLFTQCLWLVFAIITRQWYFLPGTLGYGAVYVRNFLAWGKDEKESDDGSDRGNAGAGVGNGAGAVGCSTDHAGPHSCACGAPVLGV